MKLTKLPIVLIPIILASLSGCAPTLHQAAIRGDTQTMEILLNQGANVNENYAGTALHFASRRCRIEPIRLLITRGADTNAIDKWGRTPIDYATDDGCTETVDLLLKNGAEVTPRAMKKAEEYPTILDLLQKAKSTAKAARSKPVFSGEPASQGKSVPMSSDDLSLLPKQLPSQKRRAYAVVIGIEQYRERLPKAEFADQDAILMGEYLTKVLGYPEENVVVRVNAKAAKTDLDKYLGDWLRNNVEPDSSVFVYYSGHGAPNPKTGEAYLVPYDGDPAFVESTAYPLKNLYAALEKLPARDITVVLDSCFSGAGGRSVLAAGARPMVLSVASTIMAGEKTIVLTASAGDQISNTYQEKGHGLLTYYFLKGLRGEGDLNKDGVIDMAELYEYVKPNVQRVARKQYNTEQTPQLLANPDLLLKGGGQLLEASRP